jgi:molybdopterin converting factor small subunit
MIKVNIAGFLTDFTNGQSQIVLESSPDTLRKALSGLWAQHLGLRDRVLNEQGDLRPHVNIFIDGENVRRKHFLDTTLLDGSEITILPSVSGGAE